MVGGVPDVSLFLFRADRDVDIVGIIIGNAVAPRGGLGGGECRRLMVGVMVADISMCATVGRCEAYGASAINCSYAAERCRLRSCAATKRTTRISDDNTTDLEEKISRNVKRRFDSLACIAGVRIFRPNFKALCVRTKL